MQPKYKFFDDPFNYYHSMLNDIKAAKEYIFFEIYRFHNDAIGVRFRDALTEMSRRGVKVKILMDSWGTWLPKDFFEELESHGGEVRFFRKLRFFLNYFARNHQRNHRKILVIDDQVSYVGSANLTDYSLNWRESMLRIQSDLAKTLKKVFLSDFESYKRELFEKITFIRKITHGDCEILRDVPSLTKQKIKNRYIELIRKAKNEIFIETPYFLPGSFVRKAMIKAAARGVKITVIIPEYSDVTLVDVLRNRYLGLLAKEGIRFLFYVPHNLHAKLILIDGNIFSIGSSNFDYRSFIYQHEIVIIGKDKSAINQLREHLEGTIEKSKEFDYEEWKSRSKILKFFEWLLLPFRHFL